MCKVKCFFSKAQKDREIQVEKIYFLFYSGVVSCCKRVNINLFVIKVKERKSLLDFFASFS